MLLKLLQETSNPAISISKPFFMIQTSSLCNCLQLRDIFHTKVDISKTDYLVFHPMESSKSSSSTSTDQVMNLKSTVTFS